MTWFPGILHYFRQLHDALVVYCCMQHLSTFRRQLLPVAPCLLRGLTARGSSSSSPDAASQNAIDVTNFAVTLFFSLWNLSR
eukprot:1799513-Amphidinium_carterae.1